jgi:hypothetical protein
MASTKGTHLYPALVAGFFYVDNFNQQYAGEVNVWCWLIGFVSQDRLDMANVKFILC